ncbi:MAG TPA: AdeC/AdeK/OprM family multidrug efflux complex outer membrane factor [Thermodesulfovibrionales bacterium]|jgi:multidrug efflux system outer membrane protein|nr:AdeC/AdeK/OprM family multidrug efflux complex outer membrane factor [Thermodesulfovibrionales bacterium]
MKKRFSDAETLRRKEKQGLGLYGVIIAIVLIALSGCASMAPKYTRPEAPVPSEWPSGPAYKAGTAHSGERSAADITWQEFFIDKQLQRLIALALENNRDLRIAVLNIEKAQALYRVQRAELLPSVNAGGTFSKERVPGILSGSGQPATTELYNVNLGISSWELDLFGRIRSLKDAALQEYLATEQARRSTQISLVAEIANTYLTLAADRELLKLAQETLRAQEATYNLIRRRYEVGASSEIDLRQAQTRVDAARVDISRYTAIVAGDENALTLLVGSPVQDGLLPTELNTVTILKDITPGLPADVLQRRPDILQAENLLRAAHVNIGAARAAFFPRITLTTSIGTTSDQLSGLFKSGSETWSFIPQIVTPIFDARTWSAYDVAKVEREISLTQYEKAIQVAFKEVADALAQRGTLGDQMAAQQSLMEATAESYRLSDLRYNGGIDSYLNVLDAQRSLYGAQQGLISVRLSRLTNLVTLYKVLGGGARD